LVAGIILATITWVVLRRIREEKGRETHYGWVSLGVLILVWTIGWFAAGGDPIMFDPPVLQGFNFRGGLRLTPEFSALLIGIAFYTAAFIAEVFRAGIRAVKKGGSRLPGRLGCVIRRFEHLIIAPGNACHIPADQPT
jgi:general L-amino acid transport system permease protein